MVSNTDVKKFTFAGSYNADTFTGASGTKDIFRYQNTRKKSNASNADTLSNFEVGDVIQLANRLTNADFKANGFGSKAKNSKNLAISGDTLYFGNSSGSQGSIMGLSGMTFSYNASKKTLTRTK